MYMDDDTMTPKDRIGEGLLQRMLNSNGTRPLGDLPPEDSEKAPCLPRSSWGLREVPLGMVYAPLQEFRHLYDRDKALRQGTIFRELDLPFMGESVAREGGAFHD